MSIASFGGITFEASMRSMMPISSVKRELGLDTETQDQVRAKPATVIKGPKLEQLTVEAHLVRAWGRPPEIQIKRFQQLLEVAAPYKFVLGGTPVGRNRWLLTGVSVDAAALGINGEMLDVTLSLTLQEFVKEGQTVASAGAWSGASAPGVADAEFDLIPYKVGTADEQSKEDKKRTLQEGRLSQG